MKEKATIIAKQKITDPRVVWSSYGYHKENDSIYIAQKDNKYGIINQYYDWLLPCCYDNLVELSHGYLLALKGVKQGLLLITKGSDESHECDVEEIIPCEYDLITVNDYIAIMQNNSMSGTEIEICFLVNGQQNGVFNEYTLFPNGIIEVKSTSKRMIFDWEGRVVLTSEPGWEVSDVWAREDEYGNCFPIILDSLREEDVEKKRFIYWGGRYPSEYRFIGEESVSFIDGGPEASVRPSVKNIVIKEKCGKVIVLDNCLNMINIY